MPEGFRSLKINQKTNSLFRLDVGFDFNMNRAGDVAQLLRQAAEEIEKRQNEMRGSLAGQQPFLIDDVVVDISYGLISIYCRTGDEPEITEYPAEGEQVQG